MVTGVAEDMENPEQAGSVEAADGAQEIMNQVVVVDKAVMEE